MSAPVIVEVTRGSEVESRHRGEVAVVESAPPGPVRFSLGDPEALVCMRSLAKPFQALPIVASGTAAALGFGPEELAIFCGSINGQDFQVALVERVLARIGLTPGALQCGIHAPQHRPTAKALAAAGQNPTALHHNCAGKHSGMLAMCVHHGWPVENYLDPEHPLQRLILQTVAETLGLLPEQIPVVIDGCGAPVFFVPLRRIAWGYARLAAAPPESPAGTLMAACLTNPRHIAGDGRLETHIMQALPGRVFAKAGAEGGYALALVREGLGVALKIEDGNQRAIAPAIMALLEHLQMLTPQAREALAAYRTPPVLNFHKQAVGQIRAVFAVKD